MALKGRLLQCQAACKPCAAMTSVGVWQHPGTFPMVLTDTAGAHVYPSAPQQPAAPAAQGLMDAHPAAATTGPSG